MAVTKQHTLKDVARELGLTHQRVQQIEQRAIRKCRAWCAARGIALDDVLPDIEGVDRPEQHRG